MYARLHQLTHHLTRQTTTLRSSSIMVPNTATARQHLSAPLHTAACLIIGDEVLNGKTRDTNSSHMARFCFSLGISLQRIEVIPDSAADISASVRRLSAAHDLVVTSGGIGPTHDDITYAAIADAFSLPLVLHGPTWARMRALSKPHKSQPDFSWDEPSAALEAKRRMAVLPWDEALADEEQVRFVADDLWVPVSVVNGNVHVLPGVPRLFERMLDGLGPELRKRCADPAGKGDYRVMFSTPLAESAVAGYLTELSEQVKDKGVKVGSYPRWGKSRNTVTLVGRDREYMDSLVDKVAEGVKGMRVDREDEMDDEGSDKDT